MAAWIASPAQSQTIVDACERVVVFELGISEVYLEDVQSFPELDPPRVRMRIWGKRPSTGTANDMMRKILGVRPDSRAPKNYGIVRCEFESNSAPFGLTKFECAARPCFISGSRFEELRVLLHRETATNGEQLAPLPKAGLSPVNTVSTGQSGPPLTGGEKDALRVAVQRCWNVGSLPSDALSTTVVVAVSIARDGKPDTGSIRMLSSSGGSADAARQAFEAARRAIIRCGAPGFDLPLEKSSHWQDLELTFNPESMRIK